MTILTGGVLALRVFTQAAMLTFAAHYLGPAEYGRVAAATSIAFILGIVSNLGAGTTVIARSGRNADVASDIWQFAWPQLMVLGSLLAIGYVLVGSNVWTTGLSKGTLSAIAISEAVVMPAALQISATLQAIDKVPLSQALQCSILLLRVSAVGGCLMAYGPGGSVAYYAWAQLLASIAGLALTAIVASRYIVLFSRPRLPTRTEFLQGIAYCASSGVGAASMEIDKVAALSATSAFEAGIYATMSRIVSAGTMPIIGLMMSAQPRLFAHGTSVGHDMRRIVRHIAMTCIAVGVLASTVLVAGRPLLHIIFGSRFNALTQVLPIMVLAIPAMSLRLAGTNILLTLGRPSRRIVSDLAGIAILIASMPLLGRAYGLEGLGISLVVSEIFLAAISWWFVVTELGRSDRQSAQSPY